MYCCDLNPDRANFRLSELSNAIKDIEIVSKRMKGQPFSEPTQSQEPKEHNESFD